MDNMIPFKLILAVQKGDNAIGKGGNLPWKRKEGDMAFFKTTTLKVDDENKKNVVFYGSSTYKTFQKRGPLKGRINIVLSNNKKLRKDIETNYGDAETTIVTVRSFDELYGWISDHRKEIDQVFCIGGARVYEQAMQSPYCEGVIISKIDTAYEECDTFFDVEELEEKFILEKKEDKNEERSYAIEYWARNLEEMQYLNLIKRCIHAGYSKDDRTGVGTSGFFGEMMKFNLAKGFPLFTTKKVYWKGVAKELLWFIRGATDAKELSKEGVRIWDANGSREFLDKRGLTNYKEGELGPVYGFQWRFFGADYKGAKVDYQGQGVDQLQNCIDTIKNNPASRRIIMSAWNASDINKMALPPCHVMCQFIVEGDRLSCMLYQRSCDLGLGVPFNVASYALLTMMVAHVTGLKPGFFTHVLGDAHVYKNHIEPLKKQLARIPYAFPTLEILNDRQTIDEFVYSDFKIHNYKSYKSIKMEMAV